MKKFLSVLLALAVAFTFTFGSTMSAFAATTHNVTLAELSAGYTAAESALTAKDAVKYEAVATEADDTFADVEGLYKVVDGKYVLANKLEDNNPGETTETYYKKYSYAIPLSAWQEALKALYEDTVDSIAKNSLYTVSVESETDEYITLAVKNKLLADLYAENSTYGGYAAATQYANEIAKIAAVYEACDTSIYSEKEYTAEQIGTTPYNEYAWVVDSTTYTVAKQAADAQVKADVKSFNTAYATLYSNVVSGTDTATYAEVVGSYMAAAKTLTDGEYVLSQNFLKKSKEASLEAKDEADRATGLTVLANDIATFLDSDEYADYTAKTTPTKAEVDEAIAAYKTAQTWLNNNVAKYTTDTLTYEGIKSYPNAVAYVDKFNAKAAELKAKKNDDGSDMYDAKVVDDALFTATKTQYQNPSRINVEFNPAIKNYISDVEKAIYKAAVVIDTDTSDDYTGIALDAIVDATDIDADFYAKEWTDAKAAIDTYYAAVDAAKTIDDVKEAQKALKTAIDALNNKGEVEALYTGTGTGSVKTTFVNERTALINYYQYFVKLDTTVEYVDEFSDVPQRGTPSTDVSATDGTLTYWYILQGARTADEVKALHDQAQAAITAAKTTKQLKAEAQAVVDMIKALPTNPTLADKAAVEAAKEAYDELGRTYQAYVSNAATLTNAIKAVQIDELNAVEAADKALPTSAKATIADKEAANALYDAIKEYTTTDMYSQPSYSTAKAIDVIKAIQTLELNAIKDSVEALPSTGKVTVDDQKKIEALRAAYDAYINDYVTNYDANKHNTLNDDAITALKGYEEKIAAAEIELAAAVAEAEWTATDVKASLFDSSRKLTIWRTSKTSIRVASVGSVADIKDHGYTVKYKFYKKNPGATSYKLIKTTTSNKYTYTNLKKGTNKFQVKVCVYDADGKLVASKWTYYRAAKVK